ncbi:MAG: 50S ribosomal protein L4, partial [Clostridiales bacterium]|nr:50S ribosomal protein L4 [Clostridiales bacterium]
MPKFRVYNLSGEGVDEIELNEKVFGVEPNIPVMHEVVKNYLANNRQGTQSAKTRAEVRGGGKKPFRQKGTGNARQGT